MTHSPQPTLPSRISWGLPAGSTGKKSLLAALIIFLILWLPLALSLSPSTALAAGFSDLKGNWAAPEITRAVDAGYIKGYPDGRFKPAARRDPGRIFDHGGQCLPACRSPEPGYLPGRAPRRLVLQFRPDSGILRSRQRLSRSYLPPATGGDPPGGSLHPGSAAETAGRRSSFHRHPADRHLGETIRKPVGGRGNHHRLSGRDISP